MQRTVVNICTAAVLCIFARQCVCVFSLFSHIKQPLLPQTEYRLVFIMEMQCVFCEVGGKCLCIIIIIIIIIWMELRASLEGPKLMGLGVCCRKMSDGAS